MLKTRPENIYLHRHRPVLQADADFFTSLCLPTKPGGLVSRCVLANQLSGPFSLCTCSYSVVMGAEKLQTNVVGHKNDAPIITDAPSRLGEKSRKEVTRSPPPLFLTRQNGGGKGGSGEMGNIVCRRAHNANLGGIGRPSGATLNLNFRGSNFSVDP